MKNLYVRVAEFCYDHPAGFTFQELKSSIQLGKEEEVIMREHFNNAYFKIVREPTSTLDTMFLVIQQGQSYENSKCILTFEAYFSYFDYLEFQEARKISEQAIKSAIDATNLAKESIFYAKWALVLSVVFSIGGIIVQIWSVYQSTQLDGKQFNEIKNIISSEVRK